MKNLFILTLFTLILPVASQAVTFKIVDRSGSVIAKGKRDAQVSENIGQFTVETLNALQAQGKLTWQGSGSEVISIDGQSAFDLAISPTESKAYGWCYRVNGKLVDDLASNIAFQSNDDKLEWYVGYAHQKNGSWDNGCSRD